MRSAQESPTVSVCIPAYNNAPAFSRCLQAVLAQQNVSLECVVSDDSDTDAIHDLVRACGDTRVVYKRNIPALKAPANWNAALALARGEIVTLLHQDDWYRSPDALQKVCTRMEETGAKALVAGRALHCSGDCVGEYVPSDATLRDFSARYPGRSLVVNTLGSPSVVFFRRELAAVHYDTRLLYFSDTEYYARLFAAGKSVACLSLPVVGIERGAEGQLSGHCLSRLDELVPELARALAAFHAGAVDSGLALARFFAANMRHWMKGHILDALAEAGRAFALPALLVAGASLPVFSVHMIYRLFRRLSGRQPWG